MKRFRVWWIPQVPMKAFRREVDTLVEARTLINVLAEYDLFQFENNIKPDYCNAGGIEVWDPEVEEWSTVEDDDEEKDFPWLDVDADSAPNLEKLAQRPRRFTRDYR